jgi:hypothetical protein
MAWTRDQMAARAASELRDGFYVNLGIGIPTLVANFVPNDIEVWLQSENGMLGIGPFPTEDEVDDSSPYWRKEKVSFSAAYGDERVAAFVFLPKNAKPPYQALVFYPGAGAASSTFASMDGFNRIEFIIRSGRAVIYPIYLETFDRQLPPASSVA